MKIIITGGAGFIGSHLADRLIARGDEVVIIDNLATGQKRNIPDGAEFYNLTLGDTPISPETDICLLPIWKDVDLVVHAAASYKDPNDWDSDIMTNVRGTAQVIKAMQVMGVQRMIYFQTALMYGLKPPARPLKITQPQNPAGSSYAVTKTAGENLISTSGLDFVSFRLANCYGPRNLSGPVPTFYKRLTEDLPCTVVDTFRDFVYVSDLMDVVLKAVDGKGNGFYHVSSGKHVRIADLYYAVCDALSIDRPVKVSRRSPDDAKTILLDPSLTNDEFNWKTRTKLLKGIRSAINYYMEYGVGDTYTHLRLDEAQGKTEGK